METSTLVLAQKYPTLRELEHSDWRNEFPQRTRQRICYQIANVFKQHFANNFLCAVSLVIAQEFEATIFNYMATSEADYLRKIIFKLFSFKDNQMESSSSTQSANQTNQELRIPPTTRRGSMPQTSRGNAVSPDIHTTPAISAIYHDEYENSATCTGTHNQGLDWQAETLEKINYLKQIYGKRFRDVYYWVKVGSEKKGRGIIGPNLFQDCIPELDLIARIFLLMQKELVSIKLKENILRLVNRILYYIDAKESSISSEEIYSKLETSSPDENQEFVLNELIKAFLMDRAKKLGVYIHLVEDEDVRYVITYSLQNEIVQIINEWCDHKIKILTQTQPTMQETEEELSIWQVPGSELQQWSLLKHLPMKVGPIQRHPDPLFEKVRSIWEMQDTKLQQPGWSQQHRQQQVSPAWQHTVPFLRQARFTDNSSITWSSHKQRFTDLNFGLRSKKPVVIPMQTTHQPAQRMDNTQAPCVLDQ